jgi:hypothetical protein
MSLILGILDSGGAAASAGSYESIATLTATASQTTLNFTSIPSTYSHLQIRWIAKDVMTAAADDGIQFQLNGLAGTNYAYHTLKGNGSAASAAGTASTSFFGTPYGQPSSSTGTTNMFGIGIFDLIDYASTTKYKTVKVFSGSNINTTSTLYGVSLTSALITTTNAITSILIYASGSGFVAGSTFALYGIKGV